jgi:2,3-bisphosphoglycerate-dependent phosphoglycerate mutase
VPPDRFDALVQRAWSSPDKAPHGGESNVQAQDRGVAVVRSIVLRHVGSQVVLATHGNLLALVLNALDPTFGYEFWRQLSFPDIYQLVFTSTELRSVERLWDAA